MSRGVIDQCQTKNYIKNSFLGSFKLVICKQICQDQTDRPLGFLSKVLELLDNKQMGSGVHFSKNIIPVLICGRPSKMNLYRRAFTKFMRGLRIYCLYRI